MSRYTFPSVPPGHEISDAAARDAAISVRQWYEHGGEEGRIETDALVTVVRWAIHRTRVLPEPTPAAPEAQPEREVGSPQDGAKAPAPRLSIAPRKHRGPLAGLSVSQDLRAKDQGIESPPPEGEPK